MANVVRGITPVTQAEPLSELGSPSEFVVPASNQDETQEPARWVLFRTTRVAVNVTALRKLLLKRAALHNGRPC
jgi:hypothetical protein